MRTRNHWKKCAAGEQHKVLGPSRLKQCRYAQAKHDALFAFGAGTKLYRRRSFGGIEALRNGRRVGKGRTPRAPRSCPLPQPFYWSRNSIGRVQLGNRAKRGDIHGPFYWSKGASVAQVDFASLRPSMAHMAIAQLVQDGIVEHVLTQNIDGLHGKSGVPNSRLTEMHGNIEHARCNTCGHVYRGEMPPPSTLVPERTLCTQPGCPAAG